MKQAHNPQQLSETQLQERTGISRDVFKKVLQVLQQAEDRKRARGGRRNKLEVNSRLMMSLEYWRGGQTYSFLGEVYGISQAGAYKAVSWVRDILKRNADFSYLIPRHVEDD